MGRNIEITQCVGEAFECNAIEWRLCADRFDVNSGFLLDAICIEEFASEIDNGFAAPGHTETTGIGDGGDVDTFKILFVGLSNEVSDLRGVNTNSHTFLRFRNCKLSSIKTIIFLGDSIKVDFKAVGNFANRDRYSSCSKVVTDLYLWRKFRISKEALNFTFGGSISFLNFG